MGLLAYAVRKSRLLQLGHAVVGHAPLRVEPSSGRIRCDGCERVISPGRSI